MSQPFVAFLQLDLYILFSSFFASNFMQKSSFYKLERRLGKDCTYNSNLCRTKEQAGGLKLTVYCQLLWLAGDLNTVISNLQTVSCLKTVLRLCLGLGLWIVLLVVTQRMIKKINSVGRLHCLKHL